MVYAGVSFLYFAFFFSGLVWLWTATNTLPHNLPVAAPGQSISSSQILSISGDPDNAKINVPTSQHRHYAAEILSYMLSANDYRNIFGKNAKRPPPAWTRSKFDCPDATVRRGLQKGPNDADDHGRRGPAKALLADLDEIQLNDDPQVEDQLEEEGDLQRILTLLGAQEPDIVRGAHGHERIHSEQSLPKQASSINTNTENMNTKICTPHFWCIGAAKTGTTWLFTNFLNQHPNLEVHPKETQVLRVAMHEFYKKDRESTDSGRGGYRIGKLANHINTEFCKQFEETSLIGAERWDPHSHSKNHAFKSSNLNRKHILPDISTTNSNNNKQEDPLSSLRLRKLRRSRKVKDLKFLLRGEKSPSNSAQLLGGFAARAAGVQKVY